MLRRRLKVANPTAITWTDRFGRIGKNGSRMRQEIYCGLTDQHLLVEEDDIMRELLHRSLAGAGFSVHSAADGTEALGWSQQHQGTIEILVSDIMLPGLGGIELSQRIRAARPETKFLFITGFGDQFPELQEFGIPILEKPFLPSELLRKVEDILNPGQADTGTG